MATTSRILIADDEQVIREGCIRSLSGQGRLVDAVADGGQCVERLKRSHFDIVVLDLLMPVMDGFEVLRWVRENIPDTRVVVITGFATVDKAVQAMKDGACDFVCKPFSPDTIRMVVSRVEQSLRLEDEACRLRQEKASDLYTIVQEQSRLKTVFNCMEGAVLVTNREGKVVLHNPAAVKVLDLQAEPVIGKPIHDVIRHRNAVSMIDDVTSNLVAVTREFEPGTVSGLHLRASCAPVRTASGKIFGSVTVFEDITTQKRIEQLKSEFVNMVAHELRAPLAAVEQMIYTLKAGLDMDASRRQDLLERIEARNKGLLQMIENLLSLSRLEAGAVTFNLETSRGNDMLAEVVELMRPRAENKGVELTHTPAREDWWVDVDHEQIRGVFTNLIDNAIKYTPQNGRVEVAAAIGSGLINIRVTDTGIGIAAGDMPHIFDRFFRVKNKQTRGITGSGLGLSLAKRVVDAHRGYIDVASEPGSGATFTVSLPLATPPLPPGENPAPGAP